MPVRGPEHGTALNLPKPECRYGYTEKQVSEIIGKNLSLFDEWMMGQTFAICEGREWDEKQKIYVPSCGGIHHGPIVYRQDLERFLLRLPPLD
jgi:hypothetical protein